jgi:hypothetical protein
MSMYDRVVATEAASVLSEGLALPEKERARVAAELFASLESPDPDHSAEKALARAREIEGRIERFATGESEGVELTAVRQRVESALDGE